MGCGFFTGSVLVLGFVLGFRAYSQEAPKTTVAPGRMRRLKGEPKKMGERKMRIAVANAVARHLMMASASRSSVSYISQQSHCTRTFIHRVDGKADEHIVHDDHDGPEAAVSLPEERLVVADDLDADVTEQVADRTRSVEIYVVGVEARVFGLEEGLVHDARHGAEEHLEQEEDVCSERIRGADFWVVLGHHQAADLSQ
jgi:hypothetical protein